MNGARPAAWAKEWLLPPSIVRVLQSWRARAALWPNGSRLLRDNRKLEGRHAGQRVFILCSGPSIKTQDLTVLRGEICLSVSNFFVHPDYSAINPRYHCIAPLHPPFTDQDGLRWFREMEGPLSGKEIFLGLSDRHLVKSAKLFNSAEVHYLAFGETLRVADRPLDEILPRGQSVSIMALTIAIYLGFNEIYLVGVDHTSVNFQTGKYAYHHFYTDVHANRLGEMPVPADLENEFASYAALWAQYKALRTIAGRQGVRIFNATQGGLLDLFPRIQLGDLFA